MTEDQCKREIVRESIWKYEARQGDLAWNEDVQESIQTHKLAKRTIDKDNNEDKKAAYETAKKDAKRNVAIAKARAYDHLYADMDTTEGQRKVSRMAKEREKNSKHIFSQMR